MWVVSFKLRLLYTCGKIPHTVGIAWKFGWATEAVRTLWRKMKSYLCWESLYRLSNPGSIIQRGSKIMYQI
jgi:hypothetical protein